MVISKGIKVKGIKTVVYGPEGIGKSTFASKFPDAVFIDTEGSTDWMDVRRFENPPNWQMLKEIILYVKSNPNCCKTLVIDTADWSEKICIDRLCSINDWKSIESPGYGKGYTYLEEEFGRMLNSLTELKEMGINITFTAHAQMRKFEQPDESGAYDRWELKLQKKTAALLKEWADLLLFVNYKTLVIKDDKGKAKAHGGKRVMYTTHHASWDAKNRAGLPEEMEFDFGGISHLFIRKSENNCSKPNTEVVEETVPEPIFEPEEPIKKDEDDVVKKESNSTLAQLRELMSESGYDDEDIQSLVASKGIYPKDTPLEKYDEEFIKGALIGMWDTVKEKIGTIPF